MTLAALKSRKEEMISMRNDGCTHQEISYKYGISRERVRQIIGNTGRNFLREWTIKNTDPEVLKNLTTEQALALRGTKIVIRELLGKISHPCRGGYCKSGQDAEHLVSNKLSELGIKNHLMPNKSPFDIDAGGIRVEVKSPIIRSHPKSQYSGYYRASNLKGGSDTDVFVIVVEDSFYVIPSIEIGKTANTIRIYYPPNTRHTSKWSKFINRFDLLKSTIG
jgi:hypothetical protein